VLFNGQVKGARRLTYAHLTREQRYQIYILRKAGHLQSFIAIEIGVHPTTVSRELRRGRWRRGYRPKQTDELACARKQKRYQRRIAASTWSFVKMKEKTKKHQGKDDSQIGDAYTFVAFERDSKLILARHLGRRTERDTLLFTEKIFAAVDGTEGNI
jgi:hypothetical protein